MSAANKELGRRFTELFSTGDAALAERVLDPEVIFHGTSGDGEMRGIDALMAFVASYREAFPDARSTVEHQVAEADTVVTRWRARGTHRGALGPLPAGDRAFEMDGVTIERIAGCKIVEVWVARDELGLLRRLGAMAEPTIRAGLLQASVEFADVPDGPGLVVIAADGSPAAITEAGERWLDKLGHAAADPRAARRDPRARRAGPAIRRRSPAGHGPHAHGTLAVLHASKLPTEGAPAVAIIIEEPALADLAPLLMLAYGLTPQERAVTRLVCRGLSAPELAEQLHISPNTLQDHLKSIFEKTGVSSRRELVRAILQEQYLPRALAGRPVGASGFFVA